MTENQWLDRAEYYEKKINETDDEDIRSGYEIRQAACQHNAIYGEVQPQDVTTDAETPKQDRTPT